MSPEEKIRDIAGALVHEAAIAARPGQMDRLEEMARDLKDVAAEITNRAADASPAVGITEEMIAAGVRALTEPSDEIYSVRSLNLLAAETVVKQVLGAALTGRTVVQLPEPDKKVTDEPHGLRPQERWRSDQLEVSGIASSWGPRVNVSGGPFLTDEQAERWAVTLLAAARAARRLASGSSKGGDPKP